MNNIILSMVAAILFVLVFGKAIKKYPLIFYILGIIIGICIIYISIIDIKVPDYLGKLYSVFKKGAFPTSLFIIVMYTGALNPKWKITKYLMRIRAELSILASFIILSHNISYGFFGQKGSYFTKLLQGASAFKPPQRFYAAIISIILIIIMIPLLITSFKSVRKKMSSAAWKNLHKLAYVFYALILTHVLVLWLPGYPKHFYDCMCYIVLFAIYLILKIVKKTVWSK